MTSCPAPPPSSFWKPDSQGPEFLTWSNMLWIKHRKKICHVQVIPVPPPPSHLHLCCTVSKHNLDKTVRSHTQVQRCGDVSWRSHWQVATLIPLFISWHLIIHTPAKPSDVDSWMLLSLFPVSSTFCISTYACCPCRTRSPGYREGVWISVWE